MNRPAVLLLAAAAVAGLFLGGALAYIFQVQAEQEFIAYCYGSPPDPDAPAPSDVSALIEEARRITREAGGGE